MWSAPNGIKGGSDASTSSPLSAPHAPVPTDHTLEPWAREKPPSLRCFCPGLCHGMAINTRGKVPRLDFSSEQGVTLFVRILQLCFVFSN